MEKVHKLSNSEIQSSLCEIKPRRKRKAGHVARMEERRDAYRVLVGKSEQRRPPGRQA
jgi:hypothetical protein